MPCPQIPYGAFAVYCAGISSRNEKDNRYVSLVQCTVLSLAHPRGNRFEKASAQKSSEKAGLIRNELLDCLVEGEKKGFDATDERGHMALRAVSIDWSVVTNGCLASCSHSMTIRLNVLLHELEVDQAANERGACLEALSSIMERSVALSHPVD